MNISTSIVLVALAASACSEPEDAACAPAAQAASAFGSARAELLAAPDVPGAVARLALAGGGVCSGVLVAPDAVLTAAHCLEAGASIEDVRLGGETFSVAAATAHPSRDLALLRLSGAAAAAPIGIAIEDAAEPAPGEIVQLAGYGESIDGGARFLVAEVLGASPERIEVWSWGRGGVCVGDSGGPLVTRDAAGAVRVLAVLSAGSIDCRGTERYARIDAAARSWIEETLGSPLPYLAATCGDLSVEGRCYGDRAVWCEDGIVIAERCGAAGACGWSDEDAGFRCVSPATDPCEGVGELGACDGADVVMCVEGALERTSCEVCGAACERSLDTGAAACAR